MKIKADPGMTVFCWLSSAGACLLTVDPLVSVGSGPTIFGAILVTDSGCLYLIYPYWPLIL